MITPAIRYISSFQDATNSSSIPVPTPVMVDGRIWDQKNLNVSSYRSGRVIPQVKTGWNTLTTGAWRYYNDNPASAAVYGRLYNWYAMMGIYDAASLADPSLRDNIAPVDWEVATYGEWITLRNILGINTAAIALKESGPTHWGPTNTATNSSYFTALPGGYKHGGDNTTFAKLGSLGVWWSKDSPNNGHFYLTNTSKILNYYSPINKRQGESIRLIKKTGVIPYFATTTPTAVTSNSVLGTGGYIPTSYSGTISERGIVYGTSINPTITNTKIQSGAGTGSYTINITGLSANTQYHIRAYAIDNVVGVIYANNISIITSNTSPTVFTNIISQITINSADSGGYIEDNGGFAITSRGVCWSTSTDPTIALPTKTSNGSGSGEFYSEITGLALNTKYYVRAYATNSSTTGYGLNEEFTTLAVPSLNLIFNQYYAYHAYSLRQLSDTYDYRCLRVRRTATVIGTTTVDVFFNSNGRIGLDSEVRYVAGVATLATVLGEFAASINDGYENIDNLNEMQNIFVTIWYDQSGNNINVVNTTTSLQPRIINGGTLEIDINNKASIRFPGSQYLNVVNNSVPYNNQSVYLVGSANASTNADFYAQGNLNANARLFIGRNAGIWYTNLNVSTPDFTVPFVANTPILYELICGNTTTNARSNGLELKPASVASLTVTNASIWVGASIISGSAMTGDVQEVICLVGTPSGDNIAPNIMDYYNIPKSPYVTTDVVNYIEPTGTAIGGGNITEDFGNSVIERGVCWSKNIPKPTIENVRTFDGTGIGQFTSSLNYLKAYTPYSVRAYATSSVGTSYGDVQEFTTTAAPYVFILDLFPSAHHAFSLRKLRSTYTGWCLRVRRTTLTPSATTTTVDVRFNSLNTIGLDSQIDFVSGQPTTAINLGQFCASIVKGYTNPDGVNINQDVFVSTWFDQSGNNKHVTSTTTTQQPRIVFAGNLDEKDGNVAVRFLRGSGTRLYLADTSMNINNLSQYIVTSFINTTNVQQPSTFRSPNNPWYLPYSTLTNTLINYNDSAINSGFLCQVTDTVNRLYSMVAGSGTATGYKNQTIVGSKATVSVASTGIALGWSGYTFATNALDGYIQESITWQNQLNTPQIQSQIMSYYGI